jgi:hypothetical protein
VVLGTHVVAGVAAKDLLYGVSSSALYVRQKYVNTSDLLIANAYHLSKAHHHHASQATTPINRRTE